MQPLKPGIFTAGDLQDPDLALCGTRCGKCGETFFPQRRICPRCRVPGTMAPTALSRNGRIHAVTQVLRWPGHLSASYFLALIDLPEGVHLVTQITVPEGLMPRIGDEVTLMVEPIFHTAEGTPVLGYRFASRAGA
ncbi:MAG: Zn-ribbon domain-containing OB-fold protein [Stellaceae bacterium]